MILQTPLHCRQTTCISYPPAKLPGLKLLRANALSLVIPAVEILYTSAATFANRNNSQILYWLMANASQLLLTAKTFFTYREALGCMCRRPTDPYVDDSP